MSSRGRKHKRSDYLNEIMEWQAHQYDPGYYTGGRMPPLVKQRGRSTAVGWYYLLGGLLTIIIAGYMAVITYREGNIADIAAVSILTLLFGGLQIGVGLKLRQRKRPKGESDRAGN